MIELISKNDQCMLLEALRLRRSIFIEGEKGTGKTTIARRLLDILSAETKSTYEYINCQTIARHNDEKEFKKIISSWTPNSIIILDNVQSLSLFAQEKCLCAIQDLKLAIIAISNVVTVKMVARGEFRPTFYTILNRHHLSLLPLREMKQKLAQIILHVLGHYSQENIHAETLDLLVNREWKGNFDELHIFFQQCLEEQKLKHDTLESIVRGRIKNPTKPKAHKINTSLNSTDVTQDIDIHELLSRGLKQFIREVERKIIIKIFERNKKHVRKTLKDLKISSGAFYRALADH